MAEKDDDKKAGAAEEAKLVPVGEGAAEATEETLEEQVADDKKKDDQEASSDERVGHDDEEDDEGGPEGETVDQKRERRRAERKNRREKDARLRREVNFLRNRNEQLERKFSETVSRVDAQEQMTIDSRINGIDAQIRQAEQVHAEAVRQGDGATSAEALKIKDELLEQKRQLSDVKKTRAQQSQQRQQTETAQPSRPRPEVVSQMQSWMGRNSWFDPNLNDETSHLVKVMEDRLSREGEFDPSTPEYWEELDRRVGDRFPDLKVGRRAADDQDDDEEEERPTKKNGKQPPPKKKPSGPRFSVGGRERALGRNEVYIDAERRKALEEAGAWDDPVLRERYLKAYQKYDSEAARNKN